MIKSPVKSDIPVIAGGENISPIKAEESPEFKTNQSI